MSGRSRTDGPGVGHHQSFQPRRQARQRQQQRVLRRVTPLVVGRAGQGRRAGHVAGAAFDVDVPLPGGGIYLWVPAPDGDAWGLAERLAADARFRSAALSAATEAS